jgi:hypothetical protein
MPGCDRMTRSHTSVAFSVPGNRGAVGYDRPMTGLRGHSLLTAAGPALLAGCRDHEESSCLT